MKFHRHTSQRCVDRGASSSDRIPIEIFIHDARRVHNSFSSTVDEEVFVGKNNRYDDGYEYEYDDQMSTITLDKAVQTPASRIKRKLIREQLMKEKIMNALSKSPKKVHHMKHKTMDVIPSSPETQKTTATTESSPSRKERRKNAMRIRSPIINKKWKDDIENSLDDAKIMLICEELENI